MTDHPAPAGVPTCYRHPGRESHIRCQRCDRPICPDCMRDAAVGFQCPGCVAEGKKSTRSGRTAFGGLRPTNAGLTSFVLIGINAVVWLAIVVTGGQASRLYNWFALVPEGRCVPSAALDRYYPAVHSEAVCATQGGTEWIPGVSDGAYWQLMTSAFTHVEIWHIGFNMLALYILGPQLEMILGHARFLALYLLSGLVGSATVYWLAGETSPTIGASGAIFGLMGAALVVLRNRGVNPMESGLGLWIGLNLLLTFTISNISIGGHIGGLIGGSLAALVLFEGPDLLRIPPLVANVLCAALGVVAVVGSIAVA
jgi:membrane associated rhomboid family serine protease